MDELRVNITDPRYRYYQWLRAWYGMGMTEATHKCPFYQFMFWGSLLMLALWPLYPLLKVVQFSILNPLGKRFDWAESINKLIEESPLISSVLLMFIVILLLGFVGLSISGIITTVISVCGYLLHWIYALVPVGIVVYVAEFIGWTWTHAIWPAIIWIGELPWFTFLEYIGAGSLILVSCAVVGWLTYRLGLIFFNRGLFNWIITTVCDLQKSLKKREIDRLHKLKINRLAREKLQKEKLIEDQKRQSESESGFVYDEESKFTTFLMSLNPFGWIKKIGKLIRDVFFTAKNIIFDTVSDHCPPIEFYETFSEIGTFADAPILFRGMYTPVRMYPAVDLGTSVSGIWITFSTKSLLLPESLFPKSFKFDSKRKIKFTGTLRPHEDKILSVETLEYVKIKKLKTKPKKKKK